MTPQITLTEVTVSYGGTVALEAVSLAIDEGERVAIIGPSGAGKSTLLAVMNGTVRPASGTARFEGHHIVDSEPWRRNYGRRIATIPQGLALSGRLRVVHNVNAGRLADWSTLKALRSLFSPHEIDEATATLGAVGLADKVMQRTDTLSGGERQRVAIARALRQDPTLMLADEPTASLDPARSREVMDLLVAVAARAGTTLVTSQHDVSLARSCCDRIVALRFGRVVFDRPSAAVQDCDITSLYAINQNVPR
jgi:phosphonate transport system ATP-binding protein